MQALPMARPQTAILPLIALPRGSVLLPGVVQRIAVSSTRPDIASLLAAVYTRAASKTPNGRIDTIPIACVPLSSPFLGPNGQLLIQTADRSSNRDGSDVDPAKATQADLFTWGVGAKITGVEGRGTGEFTLLVEGVVRIRIDKILPDKAFLEARALYYPDDGTYCDRLAPQLD